MEKQLYGIRRGMSRAFTLVELLVVISIIAMLLAILMPSLNKARQAAYGIKCGANLRNVGAAMLSYVTDFDTFPCSYVYPNDAQGNVDLSNQDSNPYGYLHWSYAVADGGRCDKSAFACPAFKNGGAPRTNPGTKAADWESGQVDENGQSRPNQLTDKQAPRMAYTANGAIIPRNKFTTTASGGARINQFVRAAALRKTANLILATEFNNNWKSLGIASGGVLVKSHRPVVAFSDLGAGFVGNALYTSSPDRSSYVYGDGYDQRYFGVQTLANIANKTDLLDGGAGHPINAVGRHHSGQGETKEFGGCANFLYVDGHVERKAVLDTMKNREWGDRFYSMSGANDIVR